MSALTVLIPVLLIFTWIAIAYNRLICARNQQAEAWSGVDVQLKKRADLIPPLVACVAAFRPHEAATFREPEQARNEVEVVRGIRRLVAVAENSPELKAEVNFRKLMGQLAAIEDDLQSACRAYNGSVRDFRGLSESFPANLIAGIFGFQAAAFFQMELVIERSSPAGGT